MVIFFIFDHTWIYDLTYKVTFFSTKTFANFSHFSHHVEQSFFPFCITERPKKYILCKLHNAIKPGPWFIYSIHMNIQIVFSSLSVWSAYFSYGFIMALYSVSHVLIDWYDQLTFSEKHFLRNLFLIGIQHLLLQILLSHLLSREN